MTEQYMYGQGKVELAEVVNGVVGDFVWLGDVSELSSSISEESFTHKESYSGKKGSVRKLYPGMTMEWSMTMFQLDTENIARFTQGVATNTPSGTVTAESLGNIAAGDSITLAHPGVSSLVITDSAGSPATIAPSHYVYDEFGDVTFNTLPTTPAPTNPLKAAYVHKEYNQATFFNGSRKTYALRYKGVNLAEDSKPVKLDLYKVTAGMLQTLSMITNGNQLASAPVTLEAMLDTSKPANGSLGQYGRIITVEH